LNVTKRISLLLWLHFRNRNIVCRYLGVFAVPCENAYPETAENFWLRCFSMWCFRQAHVMLILCFGIISRSRTARWWPRRQNNSHITQRTEELFKRSMNNCPVRYVWYEFRCFCVPVNMSQILTRKVILFKPYLDNQSFIIYLNAIPTWLSSIKLGIQAA